ncbi:ASCH domain-containing protein [Planococcus sp. SE5232]|uniref:ASCH domain-containing protein n=1 Tax=unclassified Planococcus (in: firmicutes) TaxID=2662419 RepID=UPI003D6BDEA7
MSEKNAQQMPPKTCSVEKLVTNKQDVEKVLAGTKSATRRNGRYADIGEIMVLKDKRFVVNQVYQQTLGELTDENITREGYASVEDYKQSILSFHPGMPWLPEMTVWVHEFHLATE